MKIMIWALVFVMGVATTAISAPLTFGPFGDLVLRGREKNPNQVVIVVSAASGWGAIEEEMARVAGEQGALVVGVDARQYFTRVAAKNYEPNVSFELESMNKYVQKSVGLPRLLAPILAGHAEGACIAYASLVQAPENTFRGAISLGFRPDLPLTHAFGIGRGLTWKKDASSVTYDAVTTFNLPWTVIQAALDPVFPEKAMRTFLNGMRGAFLHVLAGASGYDDSAAWRDAYASTLAGMMSVEAKASSGSEDISDLPLIDVPPSGPVTDTLAIFVSGDGGWAGIDKDVAAILAQHGIGVVGLDSMRYFWTKRTPEGGGADLARIMRHYLAAWKKKRVVFIGFSLGADALPPMAATLPPDLRATIRAVALLAPSKSVELEFHISDWMGDDDAAQDIALLPEVRKLAPLPLLCVYGQEEESSLCTELRPDEASIKSLPGSHHFNGEFGQVAELILQHLATSAQ